MRNSNLSVIIWIPQVCIHQTLWASFFTSGLEDMGYTESQHRNRIWIQWKFWKLCFAEKISTSNLFEAPVSYWLSSSHLPGVDDHDSERISLFLICFCFAFFDNMHLFRPSGQQQTTLLSNAIDKGTDRFLSFAYICSPKVSSNRHLPKFFLSCSLALLKTGKMFIIFFI